MFNVGDFVTVNFDGFEANERTRGVFFPAEMCRYQGLVMRVVSGPQRTTDGEGSKYILGTCAFTETQVNVENVGGYAFVTEWLRPFTPNPEEVSVRILNVDGDEVVTNLDATLADVTEDMVLVSPASTYAIPVIDTYVKRSDAKLIGEVRIPAGRRGRFFLGQSTLSEVYILEIEADQFVMMAGRGTTKFCLDYWDYSELSENSRYSDWSDYVLDEDAVHAEDVMEYYHEADVGGSVFEWNDGYYRTYEEEEEPELVSGYHEGIRTTLSESRDAKFTIGFEVEKEDEDVLNDYTVDDCEVHGWAREYDGSLYDGGYELVSPVFDLFGDEFDKHMNQSTIRDHINGDSSAERCGGHINIGMKDVNGREFFDGIKGFVPLILTLYRNRMTNQYCKARPNINDYKDGDKYTAVNVRNSYIEIRVVSRVLNATQLTWRRDLMRIMVSDYMGVGPVRILRDITDKRSKLHRHLMKVYDMQGILKIASIYAQFADDFYNTYEVTSNGEGMFFSSILRTYKRKKVDVSAIIVFANEGFSALENVGRNVSRLNKSKDLLSKLTVSTL